DQVPDVSITRIIRELEANDFEVWDDNGNWDRLEIEVERDYIDIKNLEILEYLIKMLEKEYSLGRLVNRLPFEYSNVREERLPIDSGRVVNLLSFNHSFLREERLPNDIGRFFNLPFCRDSS
ncbi:unnamed protein product, partial [marine sediment metagenome]